MGNAGSVKRKGDRGSPIARVPLHSCTCDSCRALRYIPCIGIGVFRSCILIVTADTRKRGRWAVAAEVRRACGRAYDHIVTRSPRYQKRHPDPPTTPSP